MRGNGPADYYKAGSFVAVSALLLPIRMLLRRLQSLAPDQYGLFETLSATMRASIYEPSSAADDLLMRPSGTLVATIPAGQLFETG